MSAPRVLVVLALLLLPSCATGASLPSVGTFGVAPSQGGAVGVAQGALVSGTLSTGGGGDAAITSYAVGGAMLFSSIDVDGFSPTSELRGVGTSALALEGDAVGITLTDSAGSLVVVRAAQNASRVTFTTPADVTLAPDPAAASVWRVSGAGRAGVLVAAPGASLDAAGPSQATATLAPGAQVVFRAASGHEAYDEAVVDALARGMLAVEATSGFAEGEPLLAQAALLADATVRVATDTPHQARAIVQAATDRHLTLAFDLDYLDVPARASEEVAVYLDGALVAPASVQAHAAEGRVLVLVNVSAHARRAHEVTIAASPAGAPAPSTLAQLEARLSIDARVAGAFERVGTLALGNFSTFEAVPSGAMVQAVTDARSATQVFARVSFAEGDGATAVLSETAEGRIEMTARNSQGVRAIATFTDAPSSAMVAQARAATLVACTLGADVAARPAGPGVVALQGPAGLLGHLVLQGDGALRPDEGAVVAELSEGSALVFRAASEARTRASSEALVGALGARRLGTEIALGAAGNALSVAHVDYPAAAHASVASGTHRGRVALDVAASAGAGGPVIVALVADQATLAARDASDLAVAVDGAQATRVQGAGALLGLVSEGAQGAAWTASTTLSGHTQVLLLLPASTRAVVVESLLEEKRRLDAALDGFGAFAAGPGGAVRGDIVGLVARPEAGLLLDYAVAARADAEARQGTVTTVFDAVRLGAGSLAATGAPSATALRFQGAEGTIEAFDVSAGVLKLAADATTTATLDLASGIVAEQVSPRVVLLSAPDFAGVIVGAADLALQGDAVVSALGPGDQIVFKAFSGFESQLDAADRLAHADAIASGALIGQVIVRSDATLQVTSATSVNYFPAIASGAVVGSSMGGIAGEGVPSAGFGAVQAVTQVVSTDKVELVVASATSAGKALVVSLDRNTVRGLVSGDAILLVDGKPVPAAASYADALRPDADKYYLMTAGHEQGLQAVISLAHFSTRTITLASPSAQSVFLWTTIALAIIVLLQALVPTIRRWRGA